MDTRKTNLMNGAALSQPDNTKPQADEALAITIDRFRDLVGDLSRSSVYKMLRDGSLESRVVCGRRLILMDSVRRLLQLPEAA